MLSSPIGTSGPGQSAGGGRRADGEVGGAAFDLFLQGLRGGVLVEHEADAGVAGAPAGEDLGEDAGGDRVHGGDVQFAALRAGRRPCRAPGLGGAAHGPLGVRQEGAAHRGQPYAARQPFEQGAADGPLQGLDLVGQRGLGDVEQLGGPGEGGLLDDREEVLHLTQAHRSAPRPPA